MKIWSQVRQDLDFPPIVEGWIGGETPLYVERYLFRGSEKSVRGVEAMALVTQFGGSRVHGEAGAWSADVIPSQAVFVPANCPTHWHYSGTIDFAVFYFPDQPGGMVERFRFLARAAAGPTQFSDPLVGATALQLTNELRKGSGADEHFLALLSAVMLEQAYRVLTTPGTSGLKLRHTHFERLQTVLNHIHEHLSDDLSAETLADLAQISLTHFRRLFQEATGEPPHRYVMAARLEKARNLLTMTTLPISRIALDCGFSSQSHLTASFRAAHAATPATFRAQIKPSSRVLSDERT